MLSKPCFLIPALLGFIASWIAWHRLILELAWDDVDVQEALHMANLQWAGDEYIYIYMFIKVKMGGIEFWH